jgi:serine/threonine-protein kinase RsbW
LFRAAVGQETVLRRILDQFEPPLPYPMRTVIFPARFEQLDAIRGFAAQAARDAGMQQSEIDAIELAVDEACSNIVEHAYRGRRSGEIECTCDASAEGLTIILRDHGKPFDVSKVPIPDTDADLKDRRVGGLGIFIMRKLMDEVRFEAFGKSGNVLTMFKRRGVKG